MSTRSFVKIEIKAHHDRRRCVALSTAPALANVWAFGLFTDGVQSQSPQILLDPAI